MWYNHGEEIPLRRGVAVNQGGRCDNEMNNLINEQDFEPAIIGRILAQRPDLYYLFSLVRQLNEDYRNGKLSIPAELDFSDLDPDTAEAAALMALVVRG